MNEHLDISDCVHHPMNCHCNDERDELKRELASCDKYAKEQYAAYDERITAQAKEIEKLAKYGHDTMLELGVSLGAQLAAVKDRDSWKAKAEKFEKALFRRADNHKTRPLRNRRARG